MRWILAIAVAVVCMYASAAYAHAHGTHMPTGMRAYVVCDHVAEDSMAHVRMTTYVPHAYVVYTCKAHGY